MKNVFINNPSARRIINNYLFKSAKPQNKYNESLHMATEDISGEVSDRTAYDVGTEMQELTNNN